MLATPATPMQRSHGLLSPAFAVWMAVRGWWIWRKQGSAKAMLPRVSGVPEVVFLNTSGGLTDGDALSYRLELGAGCRVTATTQTAERVYASRGAAARAKVQAQVGAGGHLDWLPQETILFESSHLARDTQIDLAPGCQLFAVRNRHSRPSCDGRNPDGCTADRCTHGAARWPSGLGRDGADRRQRIGRCLCRSAGASARFCGDRADCAGGRRCRGASARRADPCRAARLPPRLGTANVSPGLWPAMAGR